ncbi:MAG: MMPL family transporter, partial [Nitrospinaceae bacterium]|nr:efflux RND transporter permease subunit [Nitrospinaceae bacterium]NIR56562.1 efflux RND transporter permease subunit [Nitrospinaceae bacterium]NIS87024.1 efflux RND transporter permease subunit [Nitrospinaceae bacterium]NIT83866.1 efflux RND transporter permease subunit [Nitrospinaceae bacterium]NIU46071.1 efflux RND transporter permease subunit [Nitrospinaceae bacterium]
VERNITRRLEDQLETVEGLKKMTSRSQHGESVITLEFAWGTDKKISTIDVNNKLQQVKDLPVLADKPILKSISTDNSNPIMWVIVEKPDPKMPDLNQNYMFKVGEDLILPRLQRVEGVSEVWHFGGEEREMRVEFDPYKMARLHLTYEDVIKKLSNENQNTRAGFHDETHREYTVRTLGEFRDSEDILKTVVKRDGNKTIRVRDFAKVVDGYKRTSSLVRINGQLSNAFGIIREQGANVVSACNLTTETIENINRELLNRGIPMRLKIVYKDVDYIDEAMYLVKSNLGLGAALAVIVLLLFLGSVRSVMIIAISIPVSLVAVFIVLTLLGRSINIISLAGMAFAVGMVVDNSIVILENIFRHLGMNKGVFKAAYDGTVEVWGAVLSSTLTTLAVFLPIVFIQEEAGQLFRDIAITISASIALSLLVSITVIPTLTTLMIRLRPGESFDPAFFKRGFLKPILLAGRGIAQMYSGTMKYLLGTGPGHIAVKVAVILGIGGMLVMSALILPERDYLPTGNSNMVFMFMDPVAGVPVKQNMKYIADYEKEITRMEDVNNNFLVFSTRFNGGGAIVKPELARGQRGEVKMQVKSQEMGGRIFQIPGYRFAFASQRPIFRSASKTFDLEITGPDIYELKRLSMDLIKEMMGSEGIHSVRPEFKVGNPELRFIPRRLNNARLKLGIPEIGDIIESLNAGKYLGEYNDRGEPIDFVLVREDAKKLDMNDYNTLPVWTKEEMMTNLGHLADIEITSGPARIDHIEKERSVKLLVQVDKSYPMQKVIQRAEKDYLIPLRAKLTEEYGLRIGGTADDLASTERSLTSSFVYAVGFIYLLLVALFKSFLRPLIVMLTVVLAVSGSFLGIAGNNILQRWNIRNILEDFKVPDPDAMVRGWDWITFDILTQLGIIILAGIVVNNAILIVHQMLNNIRSGMDERQALLTSCETRLRPIMMTVISSVCGMIPLAFGEGAGTELYRGMGTALIGGLMFSTLFTLFLVPVLISLMTDLGLHTRQEDLVKESLAGKNWEKESHSGVTASS